MLFTRRLTTSSTISWAVLSLPRLAFRYSTSAYMRRHFTALSCVCQELTDLVGKKKPMAKNCQIVEIRIASNITIFMVVYDESFELAGCWNGGIND